MVTAIPTQFRMNDFYISEFISTAQFHYSGMFSKNSNDQEIFIEVKDCIRRIIPVLGRSNAAYHDIEHTYCVFSCGLELIKGKHIVEGNVLEIDWCHFVIGLLLHDIGYVRNILNEDSDDEQLIDSDGKTVLLEESSTDASLTNYHIFRGRTFSKQFLEHYSFLKYEIVSEFVAGTTFPIPENFSPGEYSHLVQAADLIGQMGDLYYTSKISALYDEFEENDATEKLNIKSPNDLLSTYPNFFWHVVHPNVNDIFKYLEAHENGRLWLASLVNQVFAQENVSVLSGKSQRLFQELIRAKQFAANHKERLALITEILMKYFTCPIGHVYTVDDSNTFLMSSGVWRLSSDKYNDFKEISETEKFARGSGMPGRAWETAEVQWLSDIGSLDSKKFPRAPICKNLGIKFAFGVPIAVSGNVSDVVEIFSDKEISATKSDHMFIQMIANTIND